MDSTVQILHAKLITDAQRREINEMMHVVFGDSYNDYIWAPDDWHFLIYENGQLVSTVAIVERTCRVGEQAVKVGGIGDVSTLPAWRGKGLARRLLGSAADFMRETLKVDFGLLECSEQMKPFYAGLGWQVVAAEVYFEQPQGRLKNTGVTMYLPCAKQTWPSGEVDMCGYPW